MNKKEIEELVKKLISKKRFKHVSGVAEISQQLAKATDSNIEKIWLAAILHDVCKEFSTDQLKKLLKKKEILLAPNIWTLHGLAGARFAKRKLKINDTQVLKAIAYHVMPPEHAPKSVMIIYIADKLQKKQDKFWDTNANLIKAAKRNLKNIYLQIRDESKKKHYKWVSPQFYKELKL